LISVKAKPLPGLNLGQILAEDQLKGQLDIINKKGTMFR